MNTRKTFNREVARVGDQVHLEMQGDCCLVSGRGGCAYVTDPARPHVGGNLAGGDLGTQYPDTVWPWLMRTFNPKTLLDVGCGEGHAMEWFRNQGVAVFGCDGLRHNVNECRKRGLSCILWDLAVAPFPAADVDLIWCSDVIEHIEEQHLENVFTTFKSGRVLAVSHGEEGDVGWHHVTNHNEMWWMGEFLKRSFVVQPNASAESRQGVTGWWARTGKIFLQEKVL